MLLQGTFIADRYEVIDKVGAGGMSDVYKAKDHILGREVAIKVLKNEFSEDATFVAKFRTEAQSAAGLEHPNIVNIYDVGSENGMYFIVMEYVEGITLKTYIEKKGQLNFKEAISIAIQVGRGIEAAHTKGIIHRDIKPQNIIISTEGKVKVTDFGIARAASSNTIHADVMGSVHYSSPEQARNGFVDGKSDIYSLGIVMYEMVTGRVPFDGDSTVAIAIQHLQEEMVAPSAYAPELPISLEKIILKATMKSPDRRYATISDLLVDLKKALVSPNEDFVTIVDSGLDKTRIMTTDEQDRLSREAANAIKPDVDDDDDDFDDDDDDDDDEEEEKSDRIMAILTIVAGVAIVVVLFIVIGNIFGLFNFSSSSSKVKMIDVVGEEYEVAYDELLELGLDEDNIEVTYVESSKYAEGIVADQSVAEGKKFNLEKDVLELEVVGDGDSEEEESDEEEDTTDDSSSSDSSDSSKKTTTAEVSSDNVSVPDVVGLSQEAATAKLTEYGLKVTSTTSEYSDNVGVGCVISQSIAEGQVVAKNTNITLVISKGAKEVTYVFTSKNPFEGTASYTITGDNSATGETVSQSGTCDIGQSLTIKVKNVSEVTITYTYIPTLTDENGNTYEGEQQVATETLYGTAVED